MLAGSAGFDEWTFAWVVGRTDSERAKNLDLSQHGYAGKTLRRLGRRLWRP